MITIRRILVNSLSPIALIGFVSCSCLFTSLHAATPGLPFTEDFTNSDLKNETLSNATWSTKLQKAFLGQRNAKSLGLKTGTTTTLNISSTSISSTSRRIHSADVNGDGYPDAIANNYSLLNIHFNNRTADPYSSQIVSQLVSPGASIYDIATGDIDHDGDIDIVVAMYTGTNKLFLNDGSSQPFQGATALTISTDSASSRGINLADMNGDGWLDVVVGNESSVNRLYLNTGVAPFLSGLTGINISVDSDPTYDIKVADLNNDGFPDVAVSNSSVGTKYYLNDKNSDADENPFTAVTGVQISTDSGGYVDALDLGDVNNDGWVDVVTTGSSTNKVYLNSQNSTTPFDATTASNTISADTEFGREIKLRDVDDDGDLDAIVAYQSARDRIYLNNGTSTPFSGISGIEISVDTLDSWGMDVGDVDQDGDLDIMIANDGLDKLYVNNSPVTPFSATEAVDIGTETNKAQQMDVGDVDNDGDLDVVIANDGTAELLLNNGTLEPFQGVSPILISNKPSAPRSITLVDVNRDGLLDVMVGGASDSVRLTLNDGDASPFSGTGANELSFATTESYVYSFATGDVNNDGYPDVVLGKILLSSGDGIKTLYLHDKNVDVDSNPYNSIAPISIGVAAQAFAMELADINSDGNLDLVVGHGKYSGSSSRINHLYLGDGDDTPFSAGSTDITTDDDFTSQIEIADVNKDGALDIIVGNGFNLGGSVSNIKVYINDKSGDPFDTANGQILGSDGLKATGLAIGDVDHDSNLDVVSVAYQSRRVMLYPVTGETAFSDIVGIEVSEDSISSSAVAIADFNNDGDQDIFVAASGVNRLYHNSAASEAFNTVSDTSIDTSSYNTVPVNIGDFNRDGKLDVIAGVFNGVNRLNINNGSKNPFNQASLNLGSNSLKTMALAVGDVNKDGYLDVVSGNDSANNFLQLNNQTSNPFTGSGSRVSNVDETDVTRDLILADLNRDGWLDVIAGNVGSPDKIYFHTGNPLTESDQNK